MSDEHGGPTPGPYYIKPILKSDDIGIFSSTTGECLGHALSSSSGHRDAPPQPTALRNAKLLAVAPVFEQALRLVLETKNEPLNPEATRMVSACLHFAASEDHRRLRSVTDLGRWPESRRGRIEQTFHSGPEARMAKDDSLPKLGRNPMAGLTDQRPRHSPAPYNVQGILGSHDIAVYSSPGLDHVANVLSRASGHRNAPRDDVALYNAMLFREAPRMREALELVFERRAAPLHPFTAAGIHTIMGFLARGAREDVESDRSFNRMIEENRVELTGAEAQKAHQTARVISLKQRGIPRECVEQDNEEDAELGWDY